MKQYNIIFSIIFCHALGANIPYNCQGFLFCSACPDGTERGVVSCDLEGTYSEPVSCTTIVAGDKIICEVKAGLILVCVFRSKRPPNSAKAATLVIG